MSSSETLWHRPETWPRDPAGYVFILRMLDLIGRALFAGEWTGKEPLAVLPYRLPLQRSAMPKDADLVRAELLMRSVPGWKPRPETVLGSASQLSPRMVGRGSVHDIMVRAARLSDNDWALAIKMSEAAYAEAVEPFRRMAQVHDEVAGLAEQGSLIFVSRPKDGGPLYEVTRQTWNTEVLWPRFRFGQFKPSDPFKSALPTEGAHYLFASLESLRACIESRRPKAEPGASAAPDFPMSPYLQTMLRVVQRLGITPVNQPKKLLVELEIQKVWQGEPLSGNLLRTMATLIRDPESQAGRGVKPKGEAPKA